MFFALSIAQAITVLFKAEGMLAALFSFASSDKEELVKFERA